jgi:starch-binding outer membrane protein, SusD/RagB family
MKRFLIIFLIIGSLTIESCEDKLNVPPQGAVAFEGLTTEAAVTGLLVSAYSGLDGWFGWGVAAPWGVGVSNWIYGDIAAGDAGKGGGLNDQPEINLIEQYKWSGSGIPHINDKWVALYEGVARSNDAITGIRNSQISDADKLSFEGEARFLRAFFHFEAKKIWGRVAFIDENTVDFRLNNDVDIWPDIEADLEFAVANLPVDQVQVGRATKGAAQALLGKVHMFQKDFAAAKPHLDAVIDNAKYGLAPNFEDNFRMATENGKESIFAYQSSANDGTRDADHASLNANWGDILAHPSFAPFNSPGMQQPTYDLVNAFKTGDDGLPLFDTYNETDVNNDVTTPDFTEYTGTLDPRLDFTVGRKGIPFLGFGDHPGKDGIPDEGFYGPYTNRKNNFNKTEMDAGMYGAGWTNGPSALNYNILRYADMVLMRAEIAVEDGDFEKARELVNRVRSRAKTGKVVTESDGVTPAANYLINEYPAGHDAFSSKEKAQRAVYFERRLELALEGHRFFDIVRWGIAKEVMDKYMAAERLRRPAHLNNANMFVVGKNEYFPIPLLQIDASKIQETTTLTQNPGY